MNIHVQFGFNKFVVSEKIIWKVLYKVRFVCRTEIQDGRHRNT